MPASSYAIEVRQALLKGARAVVPSLWHLEVANGLAISERRKRLSAADTDRALVTIEQIAATIVETHDREISIRRAHSVARTFQLSAYDAAYLEIARETRLSLATLDASLRAAAGQAGVALFSEP